MKRIHIGVFITTCLIFSLFLFGCGSSNGPGAPGACGSEDTGVRVNIINMIHVSPAVSETEYWTLDLAQDLCDTEYELWGDDYARILFRTIPLYDENINTVLFITNYRVTFDPLSPDYPPIDEIRAGIQGYALEPNIDEIYNFLIFDFGRKLEIQDVLSRGVYPSNFPLLYNMTIELYGQDMYGQDFCIGPIIRVIEIADYNYC